MEVGRKAFYPHTIFSMKSICSTLREDYRTAKSYEIQMVTENTVYSKIKMWFKKGSSNGHCYL
jgi:hypothetical protein